MLVQNLLFLLKTTLSPFIPFELNIINLLLLIKVIVEYEKHLEAVLTKLNK